VAARLGATGEGCSRAAGPAAGEDPPPPAGAAQEADFAALRDALMTL